MLSSGVGILGLRGTRYLLLDAAEMWRVGRERRPASRANAPPPPSVTTSALDLLVEELETDAESEAVADDAEDPSSSFVEELKTVASAGRCVGGTPPPPLLPPFPEEEFIIFGPLAAVIVGLSKKEFG